METTADFETALMAVYTDKEADGTLSRHDRRVFRKLKNHRERAIEHIHRRVRRHYLEANKITDAAKAIDWTKVKDWLKANWVQIVQIILAIVFLFL